jgi:N-acetylglutamate synthase-like GNAT family acetyltransferase
MKSFMVYCTLETEEPFMVEAETLQEAQQEALKELGWHLIESEDDEEEWWKKKHYRRHSKKHSRNSVGT